MSRLLWSCLLLAVLVFCEESPSVSVSQGHLKGVFQQSRNGRRFSAFLGIPFAAPPTGQLRFHKPLPAKPWEGVRDASKPSNACVQVKDLRRNDLVKSEDCLYLNVYTHKVSADSKLPVMVFIHGGGYYRGYGPHFLPDFLMDKDIVFVTLNYRVGSIGFLSMEDEVLPGNNGLKDQTAALQWVRDNIAQFGGDPGAVTVFGESAGAGSVHLLMLSPLSKGLFQQAIAQSGSAYSPWSSHEPGQLREMAQTLAARLGCPTAPTSDALTCLRALPAQDIEETAQALLPWPDNFRIQFPPAIEPEGVTDAFLTADPWTLTSDIPWITGVNSGEAIFLTHFFNDSKIKDLNDDLERVGPSTLLFRSTEENPAKIAQAIKSFYFLDGDITPENVQGVEEMYSDSWFIHPAKEAFRRHQGPKYFYYFEYRGANSVIPQYSKVCHYDEMLLLFPLTMNLSNFNKSAEDDKMSETMIDLWTNFAIHGKPTLNNSWRQGTDGEYLHISNKGLVMEKDLLEERDNFWKSLPFREKYLSDSNVNKMIREEL